MLKRAILILMLAAGACLGQHSNTLTWSWAQGTGDMATGFHVQRAASSGGPYTVIATIPSPTIMTYVDTAVVAGQTNYYVVTAFNAGGDSVPSNQVSCTTPFQAPTTPGSLQGTAK